MSEQVTWIPVPKRQRPKAKLPDALARADRLIDWFAANKPQVKRLAVFQTDYKAFEEGVGTYGISQSTEGVMYRGFLIHVSDAT